MRLQRRPFLLLALAVLLALAAACTRTGTSFDSPTGPSTLSLTFTLEAHPNVIMATAERPAALVKGVLKRNGSPLANQAVYFTVLIGPGEFADYTRRAMALTDSTGTATITYLGPVSDELGADTTVQIKAQPETSSPDYVYKVIEIRVLKGEEATGR
jgi:hypothetical protein